MPQRSSKLVKSFALSAAGVLLAQSVSAATYNWGRGILAPAPSTAFSWNNSALNGDATNGNNWNSGEAVNFPSVAGDIANVSNAAGTNNQTINLNQNITLGAIGNIGSTNGSGAKTIAAGGAFSLTFNNGASDASITKQTNTNSNASFISAPVIVAGNGNLSIINSSTNNLTFSGNISGTAVNIAVTTGTGAVLFSGADNSGFSGTFTHSSGTNNSQFNSAGAGSAAAAYSISAGELIFAANGDYTVKMGSLASSGGNIRGGNSATGTTTLEIGELDTDTSIAGNINNGATKVMAITKVGSGSLTINGSNNFSGGTLVSEGTLFVNGALTSAGNTVLVDTDGTLAGSGSIAGSVTVDGTLAAGNSPGVLIVGGGLTLGATSTSIFEVEGLARGTEHDGIDIGGALTYGGALEISFDSTIQAGTYSFFDGFTSQSGAFDEVVFGGLFADSLAGSVNFDGAGWTAASTNWNYSFDYASGDLAISAIPEPSSAAALAGVLILGFAGIRRRRSAKA